MGTETARFDPAVSVPSGRLALSVIRFSAQGSRTNGVSGRGRTNGVSGRGRGSESRRRSVSRFASESFFVVSRLTTVSGFGEVSGRTIVSGRTLSRLGSSGGITVDGAGR